MITFSRFQAIFGWVSPACLAVEESRLLHLFYTKPVHFSIVEAATFFAVLFVFILLAGGGVGDGLGLRLLSSGGVVRVFVRR